MVYQWTSGSRVKLDANVVGPRLEALRKKHKTLTPRIVVDDARPPDSPLHSGFEWDNLRAAERYREVQAGYIIRHIDIVITEEGQEDRMIRAFVSVTEDDETAYTHIVRAMKDPDLRKQVVAQAKQDFEELRQKYRDLQEFARVYEELDAVGV